MKSVLLAAAATALAAGGAQAQESGFSLGAGYQHFNTSRANFDLLTLRASFDFSEYLAVEADGQIGLGSKSVFFPGAGGPGVGSMKFDYGLGGFLRAHAPLGDQLTAFVRVGYAFVETSGSIDTLSVSENSDGVAFGGGFEWAFAGPNMLRVDYTRYELSSTELDGGADGFGVSFVRRF